MACTSCASDKAGTLNDPKWRRALWIALAINGGMFAIEIVGRHHGWIEGAASRRARLLR